MANLVIDTTAALDRSICGATVTISTCDGEGNPYVGYLDGQPVLPRGTQVRTGGVSSDTPGEVVVDLLPKADMDGDGCYYLVVIDGLTWVIEKGAGEETLLEATVVDPAGLTPAQLASYQATAEKGAASGYAALDADGNVAQAVAYDGTGQPITAASATDAGALVAVEDELVVARRALPFGATCGVLGNSIDLGFGTEIPNSGNARPSDADPVFWACLLSSGRLMLKRNFSLGGITTAQMVTRFTTQSVAAWNCDVLFFGCPTNDARGTTAEQDVSIANLTELVRLARANGSLPVLRTCPPKTPATYSLDSLYVLNERIRALGSTLQVDVLDYTHPLVDVATGNMVAGYGVDTTHPNPTGARRLAEQVYLPWLAKAPIRWSGPTLRTAWDDDAVNELTSSCWGDTAAGALVSAPTGWTFLSSQVGLSWSLVDPDENDGIVGKWARINANGSAVGSSRLRQTFTTTPGNRLLIACAIQVSEDLTNCAYRAGVSFSALAEAHPIYDWVHADIENGMAVVTSAVPAGEVEGKFEIGLESAGSGAGHVRFGECLVADLTALGYVGSGLPFPQ